MDLVELSKFVGSNVRILCGERICMKKKIKNPKYLLKISFQQNFEFLKSVECFKSYTFFPSIYNNKKVQEWTEGALARRRIHGDEDDCCQKTVKNYFHLIPKIGPLCPVTPNVDYVFFFFSPLFYRSFPIFRHHFYIKSKTKNVKSGLSPKPPPPLWTKSIKKN